MQVNGTLTGALGGRLDATTRFRLLSWLGAGALSIGAAGLFIAGAVGDSVSLLMLGVDAAIVGFANLVLLVLSVYRGPPGPHRLAGGRQALVVQFFALAGLALIDSVYAFLADRHADPGVLGIGVLALVVAVSLGLAVETARIGNQLQSTAVRRQGADLLLTGVLGTVVLVAAVALAITELWVLDQLAGVLVGTVALVQAIECGRGGGWSVWRGDDLPRGSAS